MSRLLADLTHAFRIYRRTPVNSWIAVLVLAVAIAFVTAFLSLYVDQVAPTYPGFEQGGRIVTLAESDGRLSHALIERISSEASSLEAVAGFQSRILPIGPEAQSGSAELVTKGFFGGLRPRLALGRGFDATEHEPEAERVVIVSDRYWRDELGESADVIGTTLQVWLYVPPESGGEPGQLVQRPLDFRIIGVMGPEMPGVSFGGAALWLPIEPEPVLLTGSRLSTLRLQVFGRRSRGVSTEAAVAEIEARYRDSAEALWRDPEGRLDAYPGIVRNFGVQRDLLRQLRLFLFGSLLIALVAAGNVSLFLLARAPGRRREIAIRLAVGARIRRIARQLATEAGLLVAVAAVIGALISGWLSGVLRGLPFLDNGQWRRFTLLDWRVLSLVGSFLLILTLFVSLAPVAGLRNAGIAASSRQAIGRATLSQRFAGTVQLALAATVAAAAVAFGAHLAGLMLADPGYSTRNLHAIAFTAGPPGGLDIAGATVEFTRHREALMTVPGITRASFGAPVPGYVPGLMYYRIEDPRNADAEIQFSAGMADPEFIDLLGLRLAHGRAPSASDALVAVVNQTLAQQMFGRDDVVGEKLTGLGIGLNAIEIVGVLEDVSFRHPAAQVPPIMFTSVMPNFYFASVAVVESTLPAAELEQRVKMLRDEGGIELGVLSVTPLRTLRMRMIADDRARGALTIGAAVVVVVLAGFGLHGIQRYLVTAGRREYAIRASIGAGPKALGLLVMRRGLILGLPGLVLATLLAFIAVAWLRDDYVSPDVSPTLVTFAVVAGLVLLIAIASLGPARQAMRMQPAPLLRED